jgi:hypothetical protein
MRLDEIGQLSLREPAIVRQGFGLEASAVDVVAEGAEVAHADFSNPDS